MNKNALSLLITAFFFSLILQCAPVSVHETRYRPSDVQNTFDISKKLTPSQEYAGEVLSYLIQVVLGKAGHPRWREEWATRGLEEKLDLGNIKDVLADSEKSNLALIVHDANILGLSEVLYYYDKNLNQFKGQSNFNSIYPSSELIAVRILLLRKIHRGEKVNLRSLFSQAHILDNYDSIPNPEELAAMNLRPEELLLLKDVIHTEPCFKAYMAHPFLIAALCRIGAIEKDEFVEKIIKNANYKKYPCRLMGRSSGKDAIAISFLPSMINEFEYDDYRQTHYTYGFKPTEFYTQMLYRLKNMILERTKSLIESESRRNKNAMIRTSGKEWDALWEKIVREKIAFYTQEQRPLVIYPDNEKQVIQEVCPEADFNVIILGKNVYLSLFLDQEKNTFPDGNRVYLDIIDLKYNQVGEEIDQVSRFIFSKLKDDIGEMVR